MARLLAWLGAAVAINGFGCGAPADDLGTPEPNLPAGSVSTPEAALLGQHLFYDVRLSSNETTACSSCHQQESAFADTLSTSVGATGQEGRLNAPSLVGVAFAAPLTWSQSRIETIEEQLRGPMFGENPIEMGMTGYEDEIVSRLRADSRYVALFEDAFGADALRDDDVLDTSRLALASFVRSMVAMDAPFDRFLAGDPSAMSGAAVRGSELFYSSRLGCGDCHAGFGLTVASRTATSSGAPPEAFHNIGLYNIDGEGAYPEAAPGLVAESGIARDQGRFRVPSLRNVGRTAPYMHDGSVASLEDVIGIYESGGRELIDGPNVGDGRASPLRSEQLRDFELTDGERDDLIAFLLALTDPSVAVDPRFANPW